MKKIITLFMIIIIVEMKLFSFTWPVPLSSTPFESPYGPRDKYDTPGLQYDFHNGMDIEAPMYTDVKAAHTGYVSYVDNNPAGNEGRMVSLINTSTPATFDYKTCYMHLNSIDVALTNPLTPVTEGITKIGESGNSGTGSPPPHLHFEYRVYPGYMNVDDKHPLQVMPYNDYSDCSVVMVTNHPRDFSYKITVNDTELDIDYFELQLRWTHLPTGWGTIQDYVIDYSEEINIPTSSNNMLIVSNPPALNNDWRMQVDPVSFSPGTDQEITFSFTPDEPDIYVHHLELWVYNAADDQNYETWFYTWDFGPVNSDNHCIQHNQMFLLPNHPNPFNPSTTISYNLGEYLQNPQIEIYNIKGQKVKSYQLEEKAGVSSIIWNGKDENDKSVSSGVYFYRLVNEGKTIQNKKMLLMK